MDVQCWSGASVVTRRMVADMFVTRRFYVQALGETKMNRKGECDFGVANRRKSGVEAGCSWARF